MTLPYDIARCAGRMATSATPGAPAISIECLDCQRRTSTGRPDGMQTMMGPPPFERGQCPLRIAPSVIPPKFPEIAGKNWGDG